MEQAQIDAATATAAGHDDFAEATGMLEAPAVPPRSATATADNEYAVPNPVSCRGPDPRVRARAVTRRRCTGAVAAAPSWRGLAAATPQAAHTVAGAPSACLSPAERLCVVVLSLQVVPARRASTNASACQLVRLTEALLPTKLLPLVLALCVWPPPSCWPCVRLRLTVQVLSRCAHSNGRALF